MSDSRKTSLSHSAVGRITGRVSRLIGSSTTVRAMVNFLRRQLWAWPIIAALLLGGVGVWIYQSVETTMEQQVASTLQTVLDADVAALHAWMLDHINNVSLLADGHKIQLAVQELLAAEKSTEKKDDLVKADAQKKLRDLLAPRLKKLGYTGFVVIAPDSLIAAADQDPPVGKSLTSFRKDFFAKALNGTPGVCKPFRSRLLLLADEKGTLRTNLPTMFAAAAIRDASGKAIAALGVRIRPEQGFTKILQLARPGATGETYAFDQKGMLLSQSRFDEDLKQLALLVDQPDSSSVLSVAVRDPQANMMAGEKPPLKAQDRPLTRPAAAAVQGHNGVDVMGYRDYRGVPSVGAWVWLPEYDFGVITEMDLAEAYQPLTIIRRAFWTLMGLLLLSAVAIFVFMLLMSRQQKALQEAVLTAKQLGQYALQEKIGEGGMGAVYRARHAMLRRPTAIKLLDINKVSGTMVARFEREVQLTSGLNHPNTIAIYDYGRTPEGIFYYAMEYLQGTNLEEFVQRNGPLPEARVVYLLRQICGSLAEAHAIGMVHRDIKPANIFLTCRGGMHDFVKVLDFGLVKTIDTDKEARLTAANAVTGTPLYLSPEALQRPETVDARTDVYALGAVGYFLLTGSPVFGGDSLVEICMKHTQAAPEPPSARLGKPVSAGLEELLLRCLAKNRDDRPADAGAVRKLLETCTIAGTWTVEDAAAWWGDSREETQIITSPVDGPRTDPGDLGQTVVYEGRPP